MNVSEFPEFVKGLPECDMPYEGLRGWLLVGETGLLLFSESDIEMSVPEHSHCDQWGVVINGRMELSIGGETKVYSSGDAYVIPEGTPHKASIFPGFRAVDFFTDPNRYQIRPRST